MIERSEWRARPAITAAIGLVAAVSIWLLIDGRGAGGRWVEPAPARVALATGLGVAAILAIFTLERLRWTWSVAFVIGWGCVAALVTWWSGPLSDSGEFVTWRSACLFLSIAIAAPLFQTARDAGGRRFDYVEVHGHVWTNVVLSAAACAFTGIAFALTYLLSALFSLIGIHLLRDLLQHGWANAALAGAAFGGAAGLFRERDAVVRTLQRVVTAVLAVLAPVLGAGLLLFLIALPFTGLDALWEATKATTPILLSCVIGGLILVNAVLGDGEEEERGRVLHWGAMALGLAVLPLAGIAAIATGLRIGQYGFTPDRLWALTFVIVACAYGVAYLVTLLRWRQGWASHLRPANLRLAFALCGLALLLATPIVSFNAISTRDQVARLEGGRTTPDKFDWRALAFDFGAPGKAALDRLKRSTNPAVARLARDTAGKANRWEVANVAEEARLRDTLDQRLRILPAPVPLPPALRNELTGYDTCGRGSEDRCTLLYRPGASEAIVIQTGCIDRVANQPAADRMMFATCNVSRLVLADGKWAVERDQPVPDRDAAARAAMVAGVRSGAIEVRPVTRRQVFVGGQPVGRIFE